MNLADLLAATAARAPEHPAIVFGERTVTYRQLDEECGRVASALAARGVSKGDRVALWLPNHPGFVSSMYGVWRAGGVVVPVHSMLTASETRHILSDSGAGVLFCAEPQYPSVVAETRTAEGVSLEHVIVVEGSASEGDVTFDDLVGSAAHPGGGVAPSEDDLALIAYTSGTSGLPKGAMLSHANLAANIEQMKEIPVATKADDVVLGALPLFHIFGLNVIVNLSVDVGATIVLVERFDMASTLRAIGDMGVTVVASAPPAYVAWLSLPEATADDWAGVRIAVSGAAPLPKEVLEGFRDRFGVTIWEGYGLTETSPTLTSTSVGGVAKPGSVGRPLPRVEIRLLAHDGYDVEEGDPGEIVVRGPNVFCGYWNDEDATRAAFRDGWFRTGDVAIADDEGDLYIVDRRRDLILVSGFNVYPKEIEDALAAHPQIADVAVVGVSDPYQGEAVKAVVVPATGADIDTAELTSWARQRLAPYKVPSTFELTEGIPRNAAGKVLRRELR